MRPEDRLLARLHFKVLGFWPQRVVEDRLSRPVPPSPNVDAIMRDVYERAGLPVPREYMVRVSAVVDALTMPRGDAS